MGGVNPDDLADLRELKEELSDVLIHFLNDRPELPSAALAAALADTMVDLLVVVLGKEGTQFVVKMKLDLLMNRKEGDR